MGFRLRLGSFHVYEIPHKGRNINMRAHIPVLPAAPQSVTSSHHRSLWRKEKRTYGVGDFSAKWEHLQKKYECLQYRNLMDLFLNDGLCVETGGETSSGPQLATLSRKLTQTEATPPGRQWRWKTRSSCTVSLVARAQNGSAEIVHQRQVDSVATGKGKTGNRTLPTSTFKASTTTMKWRPRLSIGKALRWISISEEVGPGLLKSTGRALWWMSGGQCGHNEVALALLKTSHRLWYSMWGLHLHWLDHTRVERLAGRDVGVAALAQSTCGLWR